MCKNTHIEGGLGIFFYKNATAGGDWIIQKRLRNAEWLTRLLPPDAPLSTMRVITKSDGYIAMTQYSRYVTVLRSRYIAQAEGTVKAVSSVLRLGRSGAMTDHSSVLFNVDLATGKVGQGVTNSHWYRLGMSAMHCPWLPGPPIDTHPDPPFPQVAGTIIPDFASAIELVTQAHLKMMRNVPLVGWDVAFTSEGVFVLEVNLSCNFFCADFDTADYLAFVANYFRAIEKEEDKKPKQD